MDSQTKPYNVMFIATLGNVQTQVITQVLAMDEKDAIQKASQNIQAFVKLTPIGVSPATGQ